MFGSKLSPTTFIINNQLRCCSSTTSRLTNLLKVMKKEPGRAEDLGSLSQLSLFKSSTTFRPKDDSAQLWVELQKEELELCDQKPAKNGFDEMINLTNEGKLWKFPIDNEEGLEARKESFADHVFFDDIIEKAPEKQSIKEFMNDAALGLSRNPHMTAERKRSVLEWYNEYFNENKDLVDTLIEEGDKE